ETANGVETSEAQVVRLLAAVEARSEHPLAAAIVAAAAPGTVPEVVDFAAITGRGVSGTVEGRRVHVGSARFMHDLGVVLSVDESAAADRLTGAGKGVVYAATAAAEADGGWAAPRLLVIAAVADPLKATSRAAVAALRELGLDVAM